MSGKKWVAGNLSVSSKDLPATAAADAVRGLADLDWEHVSADAARDMARGMLSKFQPCLPEDAEDRLLAERLLDHPGTLRFLASVKVNGVRVAARPNGVRLADVEATGPMVLDLSAGLAPGAPGTPPREVQWIDTPSALRVVSTELGAADVVGLAVQTARDFGTLCLLQVATRSRTYLIDPFAVGDLKSLVDVLNRSRPTKVVHSVHLMRRVLAASGISSDGVFDVSDASRRVGAVAALDGDSLAVGCEPEFGIDFHRSSHAANWTRRPLDAGQLRRAAQDAEVLLALHDRLSAT